MALRSYKELQDEVLALGFDPSIYRARIKIWLNEGLHRVARTSHLDDAVATLTTAPNTRAVALPTQPPVLRIVSLVDDQQQFVTPLDLVDYQSLISLAPTAGGRPDTYTLQQGQVQFFPLPDKAYALTLSYRANAYSFVNDNDTVVTVGLSEGMDDYCHVFINWAASKAYRNEDDPEMANFYFGEFQREFMVMRGDIGLQVENVPRQIQGTYETASSGPRFRLPGR